MYNQASSLLMVKNKSAKQQYFLVWAPRLHPGLSATRDDCDCFKKCKLGFLCLFVSL